MTARTTKRPFLPSVVISALRALLWVGVAVCAVLIGYYYWPWLKAGAAIESGESNSTTLRNVGLLVGGAIAIYLGFWRARVADRQSKASASQAEAATNEAETSRRASSNDRYQRAVQALGSDILPIRVGAIHALSLLAREDPDAYYRQFREVLCAFVRRPPFERGSGSGLMGTREDVDAAVRALGSRTAEQFDIEEQEKMRLPLWNVELSSHDFQGLDLSGSVFLDAKFRGAFLISASLASTYCVNTDFSNAKMWGANLSGAALYGANFSNADLTGADLSGAKLSDPRVDLEMSFDGLELFLFQELRQTGRKTDLTDAILFDVNLENANLRGTNLAGTKFYEQLLVDGFEVSPSARGLTQQQLDSAIADPPDRPPTLDGILDAKTGKPLVWKPRKQDP